MRVWKSMAGMMMVEFTDADPEHTMDLIIQALIPVSYVYRKSELTYQLQIRRQDYGKLSEILGKRGTHLAVISKKGVYWTVKSFLYRPVLVVTLLLLLAASLYLPGRILFVMVDGNVTIPDRLLLAAAEDCGIRFAASRKSVRSEKVKNALLSEVPGLQWAGINTSGCTAVISVRERVTEDQHPEENIVSNLIADRDGYILSATVTGGTANCFPGETVTKGQVLVSGYTDCGICIRASRAEGEIIAQTKRKTVAVMPEVYAVPETVGNTKYKISLLVGKKRINLWKDSRISGASCGRMYEEYYVSLPGGFRLPVAVCIDRYFDYTLQQVNIPEQDAGRLLQRFSEDYLVQQMVAGQIIRGKQRLSCKDGLYRLDSNYICTEMIGREQSVQIGDINGKRN